MCTPRYCLSCHKWTGSWICYLIHITGCQHNEWVKDRMYGEKE